jgi:hypothetical protein
VKTPAQRTGVRVILAGAPAWRGLGGARRSTRPVSGEAALPSRRARDARRRSRFALPQPARARRAPSFALRAAPAGARETRAVVRASRCPSRRARDARRRSRFALPQPARARRAPSFALRAAPAGARETRAVVRQARNRPQGRFLVRAHPMCNPPLQLKSAPVVKPESGPASQATMAPISSGVPRRLTGIVATIFSRISGLIARTMSVPM